MLTTAKTREWARLGAGARLQQIEQERSLILREFPELKRAGGSLGLLNRAPRRKLSAAAKRKLSAGMRKYWARRKAQAAKH